MQTMIKVILTPVYLLLTALRIVIGIIVGISGWIFYLIGGLFLLTTGFCYFMGLESGESVRNMLIGSTVLFLIPQAATILSVMLEAAAGQIGNTISSN